MTTLRKTMRSLHEAILREPFDVRVAFVRRVRTGAAVYAVLEHGDGEGIRSAEEFVQDCVAERLVRIGDLHVVLGEPLS